MQQILNLLTSLNNQANYRTLTPQQHKNLEISYNQKWLLNLASNDYLNLASNENLKESFLDSEIFNGEKYENKRKMHPLYCKSDNQGSGYGGIKR